MDADVGGVGNSVRVWQEDGRYHLLYYQGRHVAYAVSEDAYRWTRPPLGVIERNGSKENNLVTDVGGDLLKAVFEDPTAPPEERFKGMGCEGARINSETSEVVNEGEEVGSESVEKWWADQEYLGPAFEGPRLILKGRVIGWVLPRPGALEADRRDSRRLSHGRRPLGQVRREIRLLLRLLPHPGGSPRNSST